MLASRATKQKKSKFSRVTPMSEDGAKRARRSADDGAAASGGGSTAAVDPRFAVIVHRLDCTSDIGWRKVMGHATPEAA